MSASERVYRILLSFYPRQFLRAYREPMEQAFRDRLRDAESSINLWWHTILDVLLSAPAAHLDEMRSNGMKHLTTAAAYLFCLAAMYFLGRFELRTDDTGVVVFFVLAMTFVLGCLHPRRAWQWAATAWCVPAADLFWGTVLKGKDLLFIAVFVTALGLAGSYAGAWMRKLFAGKLQA